MAEVKSEFWVQSFIKRLQIEDIPAYVLQRGDPDTGAFLIKLNLLDGSAMLFQRTYDLRKDAQIWVVTGEGDDAQIEKSLRRQSLQDYDLWVIEVEERGGMTLKDILADSA